jgi:hypothetical protein
MERKREWTIGASVLRFEPPDLVLADFRGTLTVEDIARMMEIYRELNRSGPFFMVADLRAVDTLSEEVRRYFSENGELSKIHFAATHAQALELLARLRAQRTSKVA